MPSTWVTGKKRVTGGRSSGFLTGFPAVCRLLPIASGRVVVIAAEGDRMARRLELDELAERGDLDQLRARADAGDLQAAGQLASLLAERGDLDQAEQLLRAQADAGAGDAQRLADLLTQQGREEEAERLRRFGLAPDGPIASG